jgi:tetratricopeptide (TPR) repeat protein
MYRGNFPVASDYFNVALNELKEDDDKQTFASCYNGLGITADQLNEFDKAIVYYQKSYDILIELGQEQQGANILANIGNIHLQQMNYEKGLEYYLRAHEIRKKTEIKGHYVSFCYPIANSYCELGEYDKAIKFAKEGLSIAMELNNTHDIASNTGLLGKLNYLTGNYDSAIHYLEIAVAESQKSNAKQSLILNYGQLAQCYAKTGEFTKALTYADKAERLIDTTSLKDKIKIVIAYIAIYEAKGEYKKALEYYKEKSDIKNEIYTEEQKQKIAELETKFDVRHKEQQIIILDKENEMQRQKVNFLFGGVILLAIIIILIVLSYVRTSRANKDLIRRNLELMKIDEKNSELNQLLKQYTSAKKDDILLGFEKLIHEDRAYRQPKITIDECARLLDTNRTYLSGVINDHYQCNFNTFINRQRIIEARKMLIDPGNMNLTIEALAFEAGFTSKSSFNSVFKKETGITPSYFQRSAS